MRLFFVIICGTIKVLISLVIKVLITILITVTVSIIHHDRYIYVINTLILPIYFQLRTLYVGNFSTFVVLLIIKSKIILKIYGFFIPDFHKLSFDLLETSLPFEIHIIGRNQIRFSLRLHTISNGL